MILGNVSSTSVLQKVVTVITGCSCKYFTRVSLLSNMQPGSTDAATGVVGVTGVDSWTVTASAVGVRVVKLLISVSGVNVTVWNKHAHSQNIFNWWCTAWKIFFSRKFPQILIIISRKLSKKLIILYSSTYCNSTKLTGQILLTCNAKAASLPQETLLFTYLLLLTQYWQQQNTICFIHIQCCSCHCVKL